MVAGDHFCADENYDGGEALVEEAETREDVGEGEIEGAEAEDGEDVGRIDDEGVARDGQDGGDGVDGEDDVHGFEGHEREKKWRGVPFAALADEEFWAVVVAHYWEESSGYTYKPVILGAEFALAREQHAQAGEKQDCSEEIHDRVKPLKQGDTRKNKNGS